MANTVTMFKGTDNGTLQAVVAKGHIKAHWNDGWRFKYQDDLIEYFGRRAPEMAADFLQIEGNIIQGESPIPGTKAINKDGHIFEVTIGGDVIPLTTDNLGKARVRDFYGLLDEMRAVHDAKASDYAPGEDRFKNFRQCEAMGITAFEGAVVRMGDKMSRIMNLIAKERQGEGAAVKDESMIDTLMDLAVYALIAIQLREERTV